MFWVLLSLGFLGSCHTTSTTDATTDEPSLASGEPDFTILSEGFTPDEEDMPLPRVTSDQLMKWLTDVVDTDKNQRITVKETANALKHEQSKPDIYASRLMQDVDMDMDGRLSMAEWIPFYGGQRSGESVFVVELEDLSEREANDKFHHCDMNKDGYLDHKEFTKCLKSEDQALLDIDAKTKLRQADADKDGFVSVAEYEAVLDAIGTPLEAKKEDLASFHFADTNKDDKLNFDEILAYVTEQTKIPSRVQRMFEMISHHLDFGEDGVPLSEIAKNFDAFLGLPLIYEHHDHIARYSEL